MDALNFTNPGSETTFLHSITGQNYSFAVAGNGSWGYKPMTEEEIEAGEDWTDWPAPGGHKPFILVNDNGGTFYQLMPDGLDDGFFDWYCSERPAYQFMQSKEMCVAYFLKYWIRWVALGRPEMGEQHTPVS